MCQYWLCRVIYENPCWFCSVLNFFERKMMSLFMAPSYISLQLTMTPCFLQQYLRNQFPHQKESESSLTTIWSTLEATTIQNRELTQRRLTESTSKHNSSYASVHNDGANPIYYRPHPKDGEGTVFTGVCPHRGRGWRAVLGSFSGLWYQVLSRGYPSPRFFPKGTPVPDRVPPPRDRTAKQVLAMRRAVCLSVSQEDFPVLFMRRVVGAGIFHHQLQRND